MRQFSISMKLDFDSTGRSVDLTLDFDVDGSGAVTGTVTGGPIKKEVTLRGTRRNGNTMGPPLLDDFIFDLGADTIYLAGRLRGLTWDGRFARIVKRTDLSAERTLFEIGETGTGGGTQTTFVDDRVAAAGAETYPSGGESAPEEQ